ncbi:MAG TPA: hypothetical protein VE595_00255 [Nitrososphaeraceae archaeon]|nr:hypothetical protein [Nitrososphaeraceae archaeon]
MKIQNKNTDIQILCLSIVISFVTSILFLSSSYGLSFAQKDDDNDGEEQDDNKLVVEAKLNLENVDLQNTKFIRVIGFINGEEVKQDIPISSIDKTKKNMNVDLKVNEENEIVEASSPDEFFVCAYQVGGVQQQQQQQSTSIPKFDCNEGDILGNPTGVSLFSSGSQVYAHSKAVYDANLNKATNDKSETVKLEIIAPLADKKDTEKLVIAAMVRGQIQSEVIQDVQAELEKSNNDIIKRTFTFDRDTDIGKIQIGDRYHACVSSNDLNPPEGTECEKRLVKNFDKVNSLPAR